MQSIMGDRIWYKEKNLVIPYMKGNNEMFLFVLKTLWTKNKFLHEG